MFKLNPFSASYPEVKLRDLPNEYDVIIVGELASDGQ
jgi:hypothetical protein